MNRRSLLLAVGVTCAAAACFVSRQLHHEATPASTNRQIHLETESMTTTSAIVTDVNNFIAQQDQNRGQPVAGGGTLPTYFNALTGSGVSGQNEAIGISGVAASAAAITLTAGQPGNAVIIDGGVSTAASTSGADSYSFVVDTTGVVTMTDNNTGNSETITNAAYLVFDGAATASSGAYQSTYLIDTGIFAQVAAMYNAAFARVPDFAGFEYNAIPVSKGILSLHDLSVDFLSSNEFATLYLGANGQTASIGPADNGGTNDQAFITKLYGQILHRTPTAAEVQYYVGALQGTLTTSAGAAIPAADRAQLLIYFSISPENQSDISASNGGWLINPANGPVDLGSESVAVATATLTSELANGTINASAFAGLSSSAYVGIVGAQISGAEVGAGTPNQVADPVITTTMANITIDLSSQYFMGAIYGSNDTVNGALNGGSIILTPSAYPANAENVNNGGTANLFGNYNWVFFGNPFYPATVPTVVNNWNSTDIVVRWANSYPGYATSAATLLANHNAAVLQGSANNPVNGASYAGQFSTTQFAVNVGTISDDTVTSIVTAANQSYRIGNASQENILFFGQDPHGNTMVWYWRGDTTHAGSVLASDITGGVELVGVQASSLTSANFHN